MSGTPARAAFALAAVLAAACYVGCSSRTGPAPATSAASSKSPAAAPAPARPPDGKLIANWPTPACALIISGEQDGYLEPCGCTSGQHGGLGRRYDMAEKLRAQGWPLALVDLGSLIGNPASARGGLAQTKAKFGVALRALAAMKYDAVALGVEDLKLGVDEALGQYLNLKGPGVVAANLAPLPPFDEAIKKSLVATAGPIKIGVTAVIDPDALAALADPAKDLIPAVQPREVLPAILADLESRTDAQVLLVQGPPELAKSLALSYPGFDVVVSTSTLDDAPQEPEYLNNGKTMVVTVGKKGKSVGIVGLFPDSEPKFRYQRVLLGDRYKMAEPMHKLIDEDFINELRDLKVVENFVRRGNVKGAPGATYAGAQACQACHPNTYGRWSSSKHAHAYESLLKDERRPNRNYDAECISCHTTGFEYTSGWVSAEATPQLKGNQCENCHGPASKHVEAPDDLAFRKAMALTAASADRDRLCLGCHDPDNSPHFDFNGYYAKIVHKGMDTYTDPKVHQGVPPQVARRAGE